MPGIVTAWLVGEGIIFWRSWKQSRSFPVPGQLVAASFIFILLGLMAESQKARPLAVTMAWGFNIAALLNVLPQIATGGTNTGPNPIAQAGAPTSGGGPNLGIAGQQASQFAKTAQAQGRSTN